MTNLIEIQNLSFAYPGKLALEEITTNITEGSITALVGPNGSGKTTLLSAISALDEPISGRVLIDGLDVQNHTKEIQQSLGFLPDFFGLYQTLTVAQHLEFAARSHSINNSQQRIKELTSELQLDDKLSLTVGTLSRGQKQRLGIACAMMHKPRLLLLDEPASGLDPEARHILSNCLKQLPEQGTTVIVSSHILSELADYASHMMILKQGRLVEHAPISEQDMTQQYLSAVKQSKNGE